MNVQQKSDISNTLVYPVALPQPRQNRSLAQLLSIFLPTLLFLAAFPFAVQSDTGMRAILGAGVLLLLYVLRASEASVFVAFIYCCIMGGMRRWLMPYLGYPGQDVFLMVCPIFVALMFLGQAFARRIPLDTPLSRLILALLVVMLIQMFNPTQGGLAVGLAGGLFYIVPLLWYYWGRRFGTAAFAQKWLKLLIVIGIIASVHGLCQTFFGFTASEIAWGKLPGNIASSAYGTLRAMSTFTHSGEYVFFVCKALLLLWALWLCKRNIVLLFPIPLLATAAFLVGSRGAVVTTLAAAVALYAVQGRTVRSWIPRGMLALLIGVAGLWFSTRQMQGQTYSSATADVMRHQIEGIQNPLDSKKSTLGVHSQMLQVGFLSMFKYPLGKGLGSTTIAAAKYGAGSESTEMDLTNMFVSLGMVGGLLFTAVLIRVFLEAFRHWHRARTFESLGILGILIVSQGFILAGGLYAHAMFIWVCIGILDQRQKEAADEISAGNA